MVRLAHIAIAFLCLTPALTLLLAQEAAGESATPTPPAPPQATGVAPAAGANVAVLPIEGMIYDFTLESLRRRVDRALQAGASIIVIELDTPGGVLTSALEISKYIKTIPVHTVAWINNEAYSAGVLIASACDEIVMAPASATGDCAPIVPGSELAPTERAKALSPLLEEFRDNARSNGYDYTLFHAMCVLGVEVYQVRNTAAGETRLVNQADYAVMVRGTDPDRFLADPTAAASTGAAGEPTQVGTVTLQQATAADMGQWELIQKVHDGSTLLTLSQTRAEEVGLSAATVASTTDLAQHLNAGAVVQVRQSWSEELAAFLTNPIVRGALIVAVLLGAYMEFQSPGLGLPGAIAGLALIVLLGAPFLVGLAEIWHILVFLIGLGLLIVELTLLPGFGIAGVAGLVLMFIGLVLSIVPTGGGGSGFGPISLPPPEMWNRVATSSFYLLIGLVVSLAGTMFLTHYFGSIPVLNRLVLTSPATSSDAGVAAAASAHISGDDAFAGGHVAVGDTGRVVTELRPGGRVDINGNVVDVVSVGGWIDRGRDVKVVEVRGNRIVVDNA